MKYLKKFENMNNEITYYWKIRNTNLKLKLSLTTLQVEHGCDIEYDDIINHDDMSEFDQRCNIIYISKQTKTDDPNWFIWNYDDCLKNIKDSSSQIINMGFVKIPEYLRTINKYNL